MISMSGAEARQLCEVLSASHTSEFGFASSVTLQRNGDESGRYLLEVDVGYPEGSRTFYVTDHGYVQIAQKGSVPA